MLGAEYDPTRPDPTLLYLTLPYPILEETKYAAFHTILKSSKEGKKMLQGDNRSVIGCF